MTAQRIESLQALRALAASAVVLVHLGAIGFGGFGVDIFFVISGFIICHVSEVDPRYFFAKRVFRVVPIYWLATVVLFGVAHFAPRLTHYTTDDPMHLLQSLLFIPYTKWQAAGVDHMQPILPVGWTLNLEMMFYVVFSIALWLWPRGAWLIASVVLLLLVFLGWLFPFQWVPWRFWTRLAVLEFVWGLLLYRLWQWRGDMFRRVPLWLTALGMVALFVWVAVAPRWFYDYRQFLAGVSAVGVVALGLGTEGRIRLPRLVTRIGDASYSLYLLHSYVVVGAMKLLGGAQLPWLVVLYAPVIYALCVVVALASFAIVEKPSNRWLRRRFTDRPEPLVASAPSA